MNVFGNLFRISIFGESHNKLVGITIDGCPPGIDIQASDFEADIKRRQGGKTATTPRVESDIPNIVSGVFKGKTTGAPLTIVFENNNIDSSVYEQYLDIPRPGHADFVAKIKFNSYNDYRGGGHFSGRLTLPLVAAGVIAKKIIKDIKITATILEIGGETDLDKGLMKAIKNKDSVGGIIECVAENVPTGLGEPFFNSVESVISHLAFSIPAIKGIEFGNGFQSAKLFGSENNDPFIDLFGKTLTNNSGGVSGGITNGNPLIFRVAVKPTSSTPKTQETLNFKSNKLEKIAVKGKHDLCIALRMPVIIEAITAIALTDFYLINKSLF